MRRWLLLLLLCLSPLTQSAEFLDPMLAFKPTAKALDGETVEVRFEIAKGYYLYKNKVRFALKNASGVMIKEVKLPSGEMKNDPYFGLIEVYKSPVVAEIVLERAPKSKVFTLYASYQGCNEKLGICYPPIEKTVDMKFD